MVSSMPPEEATVRALGLGAADFISKPFRVRELLARVDAHIRVGKALAQAREEARSRAAMVDILHEVTDSLKPDEMYHILARRVARALNISKCSMVLAKPGDQQGVVVAAYENPMLRNLQIELGRYPEIRDRKSTRLNSSHRCISYAVFCLKKKTAEFRSPARLTWKAEGSSVGL